MTLIFTSDKSKSAMGFKAEYTSMDNSTKLDPDSNCRFVSCSQVCRSAFVYGVLLTTSSNPGAMGGGNYQSLIWGGSAPWSNPLPVYIPFWQKRYPFYIPFI